MADSWKTPVRGPLSAQSRAQGRRLDARRRGGSSAAAGVSDAVPSGKKPARLWIVEALLALTVVGSALAVGTVHSVSLVVVAPFALLAGILGLWMRRSRRALPPPAILAAGLGVYSSLQAIPLPMSLLENLSPMAAQAWSDASRTIDAPITRVSLSLDPSASLREGLKWISYAGVIVAAAFVGRRRTARPVIWIVFGSVLVVALVTFGHLLFDAEKLYGFYRSYNRTALLSPLFNTNNLGGYLVLGTLIGFGALIDPRSGRRKMLTLVGIVASLVLLPMTSSRGAIFVVVVGACALAVAVFLPRWIQSRSLLRAVPIRLLLGLAVLILVGGFVAVDLWGSSDTHTAYGSFFEVRDGSKLRALPQMIPLVVDHPWFGIGRGAFDGVSPAYLSDVRYDRVFEYAENFVLEWASGWGIPVAVAALVGFVWYFRPSRMALRRSGMNLGAYIGVSVLLFQNLADVALEVPAVCYAIAAVVGALWGEGSLSKAVAESPSPARPLLVAARPVLALSLSVAIWGAARAWGSVDTSGPHTRIAAEITHLDAQSRNDVIALHELLNESIRARPADPYFYRVGASIASRTGEGDPMRWLNHALKRGPTHAPTHMLAAQLLHQRGKLQQAMLELRLVVESAPPLTAKATGLALGWTRDFDTLLRMVPYGADGAPVLASLARGARGPLGGQLSEASLRRAESAEAHLVRALRLLAALEQRRPPCSEERERCLDAIDYDSERALAIEPTSWEAPRLWAQSLAIRGGPAAAEALLAKICSTSRERERCQALRADYGFQAGHARAQAAAKAVLGAACARGKANCASTADDLRKLSATHGFDHLTLTYARRAASEVPTAARWVATAEAALRVGRSSLCLEALRKAKAEGVADVTLAEQIRSLEIRALDQTYARE